MDIAERNGDALRRLLRSAERFNERAIAFGSFCEKTFCSKARALLVSVTFFDPKDEIVVDWTNRMRALSVARDLSTFAIVDQLPQACPVEFHACYYCAQPSDERKMPRARPVEVHVA